MTVLGDSPAFIMDNLANSFQVMIGVDALVMQLVLIFAIMVFLALYFRLDRGAFAFLLMAGMGITLQIGILPETYFYIGLLILGMFAAYGLITMTKGGEG